MKKSILFALLTGALVLCANFLPAQSAAIVRPWTGQGNSTVQQGICMPLVVAVCQETAPEFGLNSGQLIQEYTSGKTEVECLNVSLAGVGEFKVRREDGASATCFIEGL